MSEKKRILGLFPGQGSQKVGMGKELQATSAIAAEYFEKADKALGFSLSSICFEGPQERLTATEIAQPAILTVSTICFEIAQECSQEKLLPSAAAGHSLGEYSALVAARAISFEDAVQLVNKRGRYMQEAVPMGEGAMVAILGKEVAEIELAIEKVKSGVAEVANINAPGQIVVAGHKKALDELKTVMAGSKIMDLPVSAPFHCKLMKKAEENLAKDLNAINFSTCRFPVYSNFSAKPVYEPEDVRQNLISQVCGKVRWVESMKRAISDYKPEAVVEFGFGAVLTGLMKRIHADIPRFNADGLENAKEIALKV